MKKTILALFTVIAVALMISTVYASCEPCPPEPCPPPPCEGGKTPGFWKHNINVAYGYKPGSLSDNLMPGQIMDWVDATGYTADEALAMLTARGHGSDVVRYYMAGLLNDAAGYT
jgi:hypothetical protein